ncbi:stalk domain-containing protein [Crassaminicella profunda]|uniref:stalk domain-containing protein n=1 Tax=Crassaminicella profunda TaxID=1286698 RepID=UPI001CA60C52|nr:stalk domain-containing protein [Crassaminicella profunda]QZY55238.1 cell wall hydrolase [Crassaminicella profunda]
MKKLFSMLLFCALLLSNIPVYADSYVMHTIQPGDTYSKVSQQYNKDVYELEKINQDVGKTLYSGDLIKINPVADGKNISIQVDGKKVLTDQQPYLENSRTFVPIRFIAEALDVEAVSWDNHTQTAMLKHNEKTLYLPMGSKSASINGINMELDAPINVYKGRTFVPVRFVAEAFNCNVEWNAYTHTVDIYTKEQDKAKNYSEEDLYWLSRLVHAEAEDEPFDGKVAVANVIINRKYSDEFPNTIKNVVFDDNYGIQFTPVGNGRIYKQPSGESIQAARMALEGKNNIGDCLYFLNPRKSKNFWIVKNRKYYRTIQLHDFYI